ncbi:Os06g0153900 [Oryza sativa Japonica Group]|nr:hypothetical protein EE612_031999 [Oryza sativa]BAD69287.1 putative methyl chloride transferase [Oryza sativa Japonica Group]BAF18757.1 Os06g0153900 [Oryza sativa Japonica Group]BAS96219.1 Os06g0153900 [Oryza sativa Japonica Group]|eukprot:NP_001056843.1 Os06g0153900 [Oryza sativa Japonica Group]
MSSSAARVGGGGGRDPSNNPAVGRLRELVQRGDAADGWEKSWEAAVTPWDLGKPTPIIEHLVKSGTLPKGRALVPGCGTGYDVVALASPERFVVGLDISSTAVEKAKQWSSSLPNADCFTFLADDFFKWKPSEQFDLIFDYTFFCALDPSLRLAWAETVSGLLKPHGELITLIYLISDQEGGPPFNNTVTDYQKVLEPLGFKAILMEDNELAIKPRKGQEKLGRWKRFVPGSSL